METRIQYLGTVKNNIPTDEEMDNWFSHFHAGLNIISSEEAEKEEADPDFPSLFVDDYKLEKEPSKKAIDELMALVGLDNIKEAVKRELSFHRIMKLRKVAGYATPKRLMHMLLVGNPGCGKTTVAKLIGRIYHEEGILSRNVFIETNRAGLVGQFIGESEAITSRLINSAKGGILFIDEIYSLAETGDSSSAKDFGRKVIDTLIPVLSNPDSDIMVIGAGYPHEMENFLKVNSGLASRFPTVLKFDNFHLDQLMDIATARISQYGFFLTSDARIKFMNLLKSASEGSNSGNARLAVTTVENFVIPRLCIRVDRADLTRINLNDTSMILKEDIPEVGDVIAFMKQEIKRPMGFVKESDLNTKSKR